LLRGILGCKREALIGIWRKLLNEELCNLYLSSNIVSVTKSCRKINEYRIVLGQCEEHNLMGNLSIGGKVIL
jgi:hypothetical protein